jgi:hypothetical protein
MLRIDVDEKIYRKAKLPYKTTLPRGTGLAKGSQKTAWRRSSSVPSELLMLIGSWIDHVYLFPFWFLTKRFSISAQ